MLFKKHSFKLDWQSCHAACSNENFLSWFLHGNTHHKNCKVWFFYLKGKATKNRLVPSDTGTGHKFAYPPVCPQSNIHHRSLWGLGSHMFELQASRICLHSNLSSVWWLDICVEETSHELNGFWEWRSHSVLGSIIERFTFRINLAELRATTFKIIKTPSIWPKIRRVCLLSLG